MKLTTIALLMSGMINSSDRPDKPEDYYKLTNAGGNNIVELSGFIGWWDDEAYWFRNYLKEHEGEEITIRIASRGGDVATGMQMYNAIKAHNGVVNAIIEQAFSIASYIASACNNVQILPNAQFMVHAVSGRCDGTADDMEAYAALMRNSGDSIAQGYVDKTGHEIDYWRDLMKNEAGKFFSAQEAVEIGLADEIVSPSALTNYGFEPEQSEEEPEAEEPPAPPAPTNTATPKPKAKAKAPTNSKDKEVMNELERQGAIRNLFNSLQVRLNLPIALLNAALDDTTCDLAAASSKFTNYKAGEPEEGEEEAPKGKTNPVNFGRHAGGNGSDSKEMVKAVMLNRADSEKYELSSDHKKYAGMDMLNAAKSLGVAGYGDAAARNALSSEDFKAVMGEVQQEIVKGEVEAQKVTCMALKLGTIVRKARLGDYGVTDVNQIDGFGERDESTGEFPELRLNGNSVRRGNIVEQGSQIILTRAAILNDTFEHIGVLPKQHVRAAYRALDRKMWLRLQAISAQTGADMVTLVALMNQKLQEAQTSTGDDLYYTGGLIMANPAFMQMIKPICQTKTHEVDVINPAFGAFSQFQTANAAQQRIYGFADGEKALEIAVLHGGETPTLIENNAINAANGMGWTVVWDNDVQISNPKAILAGVLTSTMSDDEMKVFEKKNEAAKKAEAKAQASVDKSTTAE